MKTPIKKKLIIVESPSKARTIEKFLGSDYRVTSTMGHLIDLPVNKLGIDITKNFEPEYEVIKGKGKIIADLKKLSSQSELFYIATDEDREGESIGFHVKKALELPEDKVKRIAFHEITKTAILAALKNPRDLDLNLVNAQKARRILDRIVGYTLSPLLIKKIAKGLSAGRVQSVALRFIVEREQEIEAYLSREFSKIFAEFSKTESREVIPAELFSIAGDRVSTDEKTKLFDGYFSQKIGKIKKEELPELSRRIQQASYTASEVKKSERKSSPPPPFNTASFAAAAARKFGYNSKFSMRVAQTLYEGINVGSGVTGIITYMRTDSLNIAEQALTEARSFIKSKFGEAFLPAEARRYKTKSKTAQEAHECIRPVDITLEPVKIKQYLKEEEFNLYSMIYGRFVASQMTDAVYATMSFKISGGEFVFSGSGSVLKFPGYLEMYQEDGAEEDEDDDTKKIPDLAEGEKLILGKITEKNIKTDPPPRYNEASLIKTLEKYEIGRPSTYAPIISNLKSRTYIVVDDRKFIPQKISFYVIDYLKKHFTRIVDINFTKKMEEELDEIAQGDTSEVKVLRAFYDEFAKELKAAEGSLLMMKPKSVLTDRKCPACGKPMALRVSRYGEFYGCSGFPRCRQIEKINKDKTI